MKKLILLIVVFFSVAATAQAMLDFFANLYCDVKFEQIS